ncbi:MAG: PQQ-binding-like beta-propeller repeat protein, partial [Planctomycetes bacterium]|nr:PQQ-binding-like beta-propeller repeat protein [Planctomycetota bacterium]
MMIPPALSLLAVVALLSSIAGTSVAGAGISGETAASIVEASGAAGGICVIAGAESSELAIAIAKQGPFLVHCLAGSSEGTSQLRDQIRSRGMYGRVSADMLRSSRLPYTDNLVNILVLAPSEHLSEPGISPEEAMRVLAPLGTVHLAGDPASARWLERLRSAGAEPLGGGGAVEGSPIAFRKSWPADIDEWTHYLHGADGNPVARDRVVGPPEHYQWISDPPWSRSHESDSSISTIVTARGRLFFIVDEAPISLVGQHDLPDKWFLAARDAFNGVLLWKVPIERWGWREWKGSWFNTRPGDIPLNIQKRLVAAGECVYVTLGYRAPVSALDARTGEVLRTYAGTERTSEILHRGGTLFLSILADGGARVAAYDAASGNRRWLSEKTYRGSTVDYIKWKEMHGGIEPPELDPSLNTATDGEVIALIDGPDIVALAASSGAEKWRAAFPTAEADLKAGGIRSGGNLWIGTMIVSRGVVLHASPSRLAGFSAETGDLLWKQPKRFIQHLWYEWKDVFVIDDLVWTWTAELASARSLYPTEVIGYDIRTGEIRRTVPLGTIFSTHHHHRCYRNKATSRYILASRRGTEFVDLEKGKHTVHNWVRGTCHVGMMPANGLHYAPPHPCQCYIDEKLIGMNALAPARPGGEEGESDDKSTARASYIERGPAFGLAPSQQAGESSTAQAEDWPVFRSDSSRSAAVSTRVPDDARPIWRVRVGLKASAPVAAAERVFISLVDEHQVVCLRASDGRTEWTFTAGARIDSPPSCHRGAVLFGSADGWIYCLRASDGALAWRHRAAPEERLIAAFGQLESAWPVHGSVLVEAGAVYAAAGRTSQLDGGIRLVALDATDGSPIHERVLAGPDYAVGD